MNCNLQYSGVLRCLYSVQYISFVRYVYHVVGLYSEYYRYLYHYPEIQHLTNEKVFTFSRFHCTCRTFIFMEIKRGLFVRSLSIYIYVYTRVSYMISTTAIKHCDMAYNHWVLLYRYHSTQYMVVQSTVHTLQFYEDILDVCQQIPNASISTCVQYSSTPWYYQLPRTIPGRITNDTRNTTKTDSDRLVSRYREQILHQQPSLGRICHP